MARRITPRCARAVVVSHPHISVDEFDALQHEAGWGTPIERLAAEVIVVAPLGPAALVAG